MSPYVKNKEFSQKFANMPNTNNISEQSFGTLKHILKSNPNILLQKAEIISRLKSNKTFAWLEHVKIQNPFLAQKILEEACLNQNQIIRQRNEKIEKKMRKQGEIVMKKIEENEERKQKIRTI